MATKVKKELLKKCRKFVENTIFYILSNPEARDVKKIQFDVFEIDKIKSLEEFIDCLSKYIFDTLLHNPNKIIVDEDDLYTYTGCITDYTPIGCFEIYDRVDLQIHTFVKSIFPILNIYKRFDISHEICDIILYFHDNIKVFRMI